MTTTVRASPPSSLTTLIRETTVGDFDHDVYASLNSDYSRDDYVSVDFGYVDQRGFGRDNPAHIGFNYVKHVASLPLANAGQRGYGGTRVKIPSWVPRVWPANVSGDENIIHFGKLRQQPSTSEQHQQLQHLCFFG